MFNDTAKVTANGQAKTVQTSKTQARVKAGTATRNAANKANNKSTPPCISMRASVLAMATAALMSHAPISLGADEFEEPLQLNGDFVLGGDVSDSSDYLVSPNGQFIVYRADQNTDGVFELYSVPVGGGPVVKLNGSLVSAGNVVSEFQISADSTRVVYRADQITDEVFELFSVSIGGGAVEKLNGTLVSGGDVFNNLQISSDSTRVVFRADQITDEVFELFSVSIGGGAVEKLNGNLVSGGDVGTRSTTNEFVISPDSTRVVYRADQITNNVFELFSVPIAGGAVEKLNSPLVSGGDVFNDFQISSDNTRVIYRADQSTNDVFELFSVPIVGGMTERLNANLTTQGGVNDFLFSPDSTHIVYRADQTINDQFELFSVALRPKEDDEICFPITASDNALAVVCL